MTSSQDRTARIWDPETHDLLAELKGHTGEVFSAEFSSDGMRVVTASQDRTGRMWTIPTRQELIDRSKDVIPRCLTLLERRDQAFVDHEPPDWCIELNKWPYDSEPWKEWLRHKKQGAAPPFPDSLASKSWIGDHAGAGP